MNKDFVVFAGVNGAGKTSIYNQILKEYFPELGRRIKVRPHNACCQIFALKDFLRWKKVENE